MWLNPESLRRWMRPSDAEVTYVEIHPIVGGTFRFDLREKDGQVFIHTGEYLENQRPTKLKFTWNSTVLGEHSSLVTLEFYEQADQCLIVLQHDLPPDETIFEDHRRGWTVILDRFLEACRARSPD